MEQLTETEAQELRTVVALAMGFVWLVQRSKYGGSAGRFLYRLEWEQDANKSWSPEWEVWDGAEEVPVYTDAFREVPNYPVDPAQIGPMLSWLKAHHLTSLRPTVRGWEVLAIIPKDADDPDEEADCKAQIYEVHPELGVALCRVAVAVNKAMKEQKSG